MANNAVPPLAHTHTHTPHTCMRSRQMFAAGWPVCCRAAWLRRGGHAVTRTQESGLNSRHSLGFEAALVLSGLHLLQLILHLACVARALCQTHRLWKNNLTGFNLPPPLPSPHHHHPLFLLLHFSSVSFVCLWEEQNPFCLAAPRHSRPLLQLRQGRYEASDVAILCLVCLWCPFKKKIKKCWFIFCVFSVGVQFVLHSD